MAERYTRVFTQQGKFYYPGAPVIIEAGALLKDNQTGKIVAQLKYRNISSKSIRALTVKILAKDVSGAEVEGVDAFQYLDLNVPRDEEFGTKTPIFMPNVVTRSFICECISVVFEDGTAWRNEKGFSWNVLPEPVLLNHEIGVKLAEQYQRDTNTYAKYTVAEYEDLWYCGCGAINHTSENCCHNCRTSKTDLLSALNIEVLRANRKKFDDAIAAKQAATAEAERIQNKKIRKVATIVLIPAVIALLVTLFIAVVIPLAKYDKAIMLMNQGDFRSAQEIFLKLGEFKNSEDKYSECGWRNGIALYVSGNFTQAEAQFTSLLHNADDYPDYVYTEIGEYLYDTAMEYIENQDYSSAISLVTDKFAKDISEDIYETIYQKGIKLSADGQYQNAIDVFKVLNGYEDSVNRIAECNTAILDQRYGAAYENAITLLNEGKYIEAYEALLSLSGYKDSTEKAESIYDKYRLLTAKVGEYVDFGKYEQDNVTNNGKEVIEWKVLARDGTKVLLLSKYVLDCKPYHTTLQDITWEACYLRKWLNQDFINTAFSESEQAVIATTNVSADKNPEHSTNPGKSTNDKLFLLSISEYKQYLQRTDKPSFTEFSYSKQGEYKFEWWWLRTPGIDQDSASCVASSGLHLAGASVHFTDFGVRPAMWIDLSELT